MFDAATGQGTMNIGAASQGIADFMEELEQKVAKFAKEKKRMRAHGLVD
jgi:hypothetical protein